MTINLTFVLLFVPGLLTMWVGALFSFSWNRCLTRDSVWISFLVCLVLSLMLSVVLTLIMDTMGLIWETQI